MISDHFTKIKKEIGNLEWLIDRVTIDSEFDKDLNVGIISGKLVFKESNPVKLLDVLQLIKDIVIDKLIDDAL